MKATDGGSQTPKHTSHKCSTRVSAKEDQLSISIKCETKVLRMSNSLEPA